MTQNAEIKNQPSAVEIAREFCLAALHGAAAQCKSEMSVEELRRLAVAAMTLGSLAAVEFHAACLQQSKQD